LAERILRIIKTTLNIAKNEYWLIIRKHWAIAYSSIKRKLYKHPFSRLIYMDEIRSFQQQEEQHQVIKPTIKPLLLLLHSFGWTIVVFFFGAWFLLGIIVEVIALLLGADKIMATIVSIVLLFFIVMMISYLLKRATLKRTEYRFYADRLEYFEGFLVKNRKTVAYDKISNVGQKKGIIEGWFGLGTIFIDTPGSSPKGHEVSISYLENPDQVYDWISKVVSRKR
jgi:membrane protein YdbS with pleckstrin-like domain